MSVPKWTDIFNDRSMMERVGMKYVVPSRKSTYSSVGCLWVKLAGSVLVLNAHGCSMIPSKEYWSKGDCIQLCKRWLGLHDPSDLFTLLDQEVKIRASSLSHHSAV